MEKEIKFFVAYDKDIFLHSNKVIKADQYIYMNMHQIDPSLNEIMALIYFESYSEFIKNKSKRYRVPNTNILAHFTSINQNTFREEIISNEYLNLIKSFFLQSPDIINEIYNYPYIYKVEPGFLNENLFSEHIPVAFRIRSEKFNEEKMKEMVLSSIPDDKIKDCQFDELNTGLLFLMIEDDVNNLDCIITFDMRFKYPGPYLITNQNLKVILSKEKEYVKDILEELEKRIKSLYNLENDIDIFHLI